MHTQVVASSGDRDRGRQVKAARRAQELRTRIVDLQSRLRRLTSNRPLNRPINPEDLRAASEAAHEAHAHALDEHHHAADAHRSAAQAHHDLADLLDVKGEHAKARQQRAAALADEAAAAADERAAHQPTHKHLPHDKHRRPT